MDRGLEMELELVQELVQELVPELAPELELELGLGLTGTGWASPHFDCHLRNPAIQQYRNPANLAFSRSAPA